jgi:hypothetical protein
MPHGLNQFLKILSDKEEYEDKKEQYSISTEHKTVYSKENIDKIVSQLMDDLIEKFENIEKKNLVGQYLKYIIYSLQLMKINLVEVQNYIPTPEKYKNPKCGLMNIQNDDQECFRWCMKYHQSKEDKHSDRISV